MKNGTQVIVRGQVAVINSSVTAREQWLTGNGVYSDSDAVAFYSVTFRNGVRDTIPAAVPMTVVG